MVFFILPATIFALLIFPTLGLPIPDYMGLQLKAWDSVMVSPQPHLLPPDLQENFPVEMELVPRGYSGHVTNDLKILVSEFLQTQAQELKGTDGFMQYIKDFQNVPPKVFEPLNKAFPGESGPDTSREQKQTAVKALRDHYEKYYETPIPVAGGMGRLAFPKVKTDGGRSLAAKRQRPGHRGPKDTHFKTSSISRTKVAVANRHQSPDHQGCRSRPTGFETSSISCAQEVAVADHPNLLKNSNTPQSPDRFPSPQSPDCFSSPQSPDHQGCRSPETPEEHTRRPDHRGPTGFETSSISCAQEVAVADHPNLLKKSQSPDRFSSPQSSDCFSSPQSPDHQGLESPEAPKKHEPHPYELISPLQLDQARKETDGIWSHANHLTEMGLATAYKEMLRSAAEAELSGDELKSFKDDLEVPQNAYFHRDLQHEFAKGNVRGAFEWIKEMFTFFYGASHQNA